MSITIQGCICSGPPVFTTVKAIRAQRQIVMSAAYAAYLARFAHGEPLVKGVPVAVYLNPPADVANLP